MPPKAPLNWGLIPPSFLLPSSAQSLFPLIPLTQPYPQPSYIPIRTIKSTNKPRPDRFAYDSKRSPLQSSTSAALARKAHSTPLRTGALALKRGMTALYDPETGKRTPCTVLQLDRNQVIMHKTREKNGYYAVQIGAGQKKADNVTRPMLGHFATARVSPKRWVVEFKVRGEEGLKVRVGEAITASWFRAGQFVDVKGISRGMGFAGGMKRHGFSGQPASHGQSLMHRGMGSAGGSQGSGSRVLPGKRMAGNMGNESVTVQNLKVLQVDDANGIVVVSGCVPGPKYQILRIQDARKKPWPEGPMSIAEMASMASQTATTTVTAEA
ncbi:mitochondrial 54S ribosomal protein YmL9 [Lindgomyces ingoldianus]|uniref:Mitochondrial 54S ribosomal protein YmL9 n=1 Tax=Lindgomyces ingoldianus TaxID=673940 RepID=A0ACB6QJ95_9PLEO|nr:mitochondrial 54S ribosomal protein YmL9 [Lindgomyces ingoldianus]KAF2466996.1 mitochondrial 54S ribosomal protein YmL9 [Lindgomyces ingoldianus]